MSIRRRTAAENIAEFGGPYRVTEEVIPRRLKIASREDFIRQLPRCQLSELPANDHDRTCAICLAKYGSISDGSSSEDLSPLQPEEAVKLPCCKKSVGEQCLTHCIGNQCPFCRAILFKMMVPQERAEDMRRWISFLIRHHGQQRAAMMYDQIVSLNTVAIEEDIGVAVRLNNHAEAAGLRERLEHYQRAHKDELAIKSREYYARRDSVYFRNMSDEQRIVNVKAASVINIIHEALSDPVLSNLAAEQITNADLRAYRSDANYGPYGCEIDYRLPQPDEVGSNGSGSDLVVESLVGTSR